MNPEDALSLMHTYKELILIAAGLVVGFTIWLRKERIANAKTDVEVAAQKAESRKHEGQNEELNILLARVNAAELERQGQVLEMAKLNNRINLLEVEVNQLEIILMGVSILFNNMLLCNDCRSKNEGTVEAIKSLLSKLRKPGNSP